MITKEKILDEIKRTAKENGGKPLGIARFEKETGVNKYDWGRYWSRFGDLLQEAGFMPNQFGDAYADEFIIEKMIGLIRKLGKFPTHGELRIEKNSNSSFPHAATLFDTKERKVELAVKIVEWCMGKEGYDDIIGFCRPITEGQNKKEALNEVSAKVLGEVYLFKSGRYYKIGKTNDTVRRGSELRVQLAEVPNLIHSIRTDDPSGVEAYWHKRFETKRMNGEWFDLTAADIKAFKSWRKIV